MTTRIRSFNAHTDWPYVQEHVHAIACADTCGVTACDSVDGRIYGVVIFDSMTPNSAQCHVCVTNPTKALRKGLIRAACHYVYTELGKNIVYGLVPSDNKKALRFDKHLGFDEVTRLTNAFAKGIDYVILEMRKENCIWLTKREPEQRVMGV